MPESKNPFAALCEENNVVEPTPVKKETKEEVKVKKTEKGRPSTGVEKDASVLYRVNKGLYREIQMFAKIKGTSVNGLIELALLQYMSSQENIGDFNLAKQMAAKLKD